MPNMRVLQDAHQQEAGSVGSVQVLDLQDKERGKDAMSDREQTIFRTHKEPGDYFQMHKNIVDNPRLSYKAKGIMAYLLSKPNDWITYQIDLVKRSIDGKASVHSGVKELEQAGYVSKEQARDDESGKFSPTIWHVYETPFTAHRLSGDGKPVDGKTVDGKPATTNNKGTNNKSTNIGSRKKRDPLLDHPAIIKHKEIAKRNMAIAARPVIAEAIQEDEIDRWGETILKWVGSGWNPSNVLGMLEYHQEQQPKKGLPNAAALRERG